MRGRVACAGAARLVAAVSMAAFASLAWTPPAAAQVGLGAERYEVTITPPKRPGSEAPVDEGTAPGAPTQATPGAGTANDVPGARTANETLGAVAVPGAPEAPASDAGAATAAPAATASAKARVDPNLPQRTLQVGAFRQHKSAQAMRDKLAAAFQDVVIVEVQSGGEALYRVNVGRLPRGAGLDDLRRRLVAAGYPAFDVAAPAVSAGD